MRNTKFYAALLRQAAQDIIEHADEIIGGSIEHKREITVSIIMNYNEIPIVRVTQDIMPPAVISTYSTLYCKDGDADPSSTYLERTVSSESSDDSKKVLADG